MIESIVEVEDVDIAQQYEEIECVHALAYRQEGVREGEQGFRVRMMGTAQGCEGLPRCRGPRQVTTRASSRKVVIQHSPSDNEHRNVPPYHNDTRL